MKEDPNYRPGPTNGDPHMDWPMFPIKPKNEDIDAHSERQHSSGVRPAWDECPDKTPYAA